MKAISITTIILILLIGYLKAQSSPELESFERSGAGLSASIQSSQIGILVPIWLGKKAALVPSVRVVAGTDLGSDLGLGFGLRLYTSEKRFSPYFFPGIAVLAALPSNEAKDNGAETVFDYAAGLNFGGEYFLSRHFSFAVEAGFNVGISDALSSRFGNPGGTSVNTAAAIIANVYF